jgi:ABC-type oligopeptide transport system ATPase subunit
MLLMGAGSSDTGNQMPPLNWDVFTQLPGAATTNFENLCRALIRRHYGRYGDFAALAAQPGVEFHLKLHEQCALGEAGRWLGWQCRWYDLPPGKALGKARRTKIEEAIRTTERSLPNLTDWVLWTRRPLTKGDQKWFYALKTKMRLALWTASEVEDLLVGDTEVLRATYFGELVLTPDIFASLHNVSVAPIRRRWQPEVHQIIEAERAIRQMLGEASSWERLGVATDNVKNDSERFASDISGLADTVLETANDLLNLAQRISNALSETYIALGKGDLDILRQQLLSQPDSPPAQIQALPRRLRGLRHQAALTATNVIDDIWSALDLLNQVHSSLENQIVGVLAEAGCGKTQLAAQITAPTNEYPGGILLHGSNLHSDGTLDDLAHAVKIFTAPARSMEALIAAVDAAGQRSHRRLPIVIDGLNEAEDPRKWKALLAVLREVLPRYPYVLVVCMIRPAFAEEALPSEVRRLEIPDFGADTTDAIFKYFHHYKIDFTDALLPVGFLKHPLTLRLSCEVTNPKRERIVGVEAIPQSLAAMFDKYLEQVAERIGELSPTTHRYYPQDVRAAYYDIGTMLWEEKVRSLDIVQLRDRLHDSSRHWQVSIVRALEQEGVLLRQPSQDTDSHRVVVVYDALGGHIIANALLGRYGRADLTSWLKEPVTTGALDEAGSNQHPLSGDLFRALATLIPRRLPSQQLWPMLEEPLRTRALRIAADLEGTYLDAATVTEILQLLVKPAMGWRRDLFHRLQETRGATSHPLNAEFLDRALRHMTLPDRDLRWTEWVRYDRNECIQDLDYLEKRWRNRRYEWDCKSERLRAIWVMWLLSSTVLEIRDKATRALYWFGRRDAGALFVLTLNALTINDPYISERMLAASYGVCMALHCRPKRIIFRQKVLPAFVKHIYKKMFAPAAPYGTTHVLARDYARQIIQIALLHSVSLLSKEEVERTNPPFQDGGIRQWEVIEDPNSGKYREGNSPLGFDFANYTLGRLVPERGNYQEDPEFTKATGQVVWRLYQLGYTLEAFGQIDKHIASSEFRAEMRGERKTERYGKKYARIAYFELYGFRQDQGLLKSRWSDDPKRPWDADIDPSFPEATHRLRFIPNLLSDSSVTNETWVKKGPVPNFGAFLIAKQIGPKPGPWLLVNSGGHQAKKQLERTGFVRIRAFLLLRNDVERFIDLARREPPSRNLLPDWAENHLTFAGEIPWSDLFADDELNTVDFVVGTVQRRVDENDPRFNLRVILHFEDEQRVLGSERQRTKQCKFLNAFLSISRYVRPNFLQKVT